MTPLCRLLALQLALGWVTAAAVVYWLLTADDSDNDERVLVWPNGESSRRPPESMLASEIPEALASVELRSFFGPADMDGSPSGERLHRN